MTPEQICKILNREKWRGRRWSVMEGQSTGVWFKGLPSGNEATWWYDLEDGRTVVSYLVEHPLIELADKLAECVRFDRETCDFLTLPTEDALEAYQKARGKE